jgi:hypothetical protein
MVPITSSSKDDNIPLGKITPPLPTLETKCPNPRENQQKYDMTVPANIDKPSTSNSVGNNTKPNTAGTNNKTCETKSNQTMNKSNMHALDYNVIEDMKKTKANISMFDICSLPQQHDLLHDAFNPNNSQKKIIATTENIPLNVESKEVHKVEITVSINATSIGAYSKSQVPPFLLTYEIFNFNVHNFLADSGASSNIMPYSV